MRSFSIVPFPNVLQAVDILETVGISIAACSNLAPSCGLRAQHLFPDLDFYSFSYLLLRHCMATIDS